MGRLSLLLLELAAVVCDLRTRKIPNWLVVGGLILAGACQWCAQGPPGLAEFAGGALLPLLLLAFFHAYRLLGAGDIKLLMMAGGFLGLDGSLRCIVASFLAAGVCAAAVALKHRILAQRFCYLRQYLQNMAKNDVWRPYIVPEENRAYLHFSIAVLIGSLTVLGGIL